MKNIIFRNNIFQNSGGYLAVSEPLPIKLIIVNFIEIIFKFLE